MQTLKGFRNILSRAKKAFLNLPTLLTEKGHSVWVRWDSIRISSHATLPFEGIYATGFNHKAFKYIKGHRLSKHLKDSQMNVEKLLISVAVAGSECSSTRCCS